MDLAEACNNEAATASRDSSSRGTYAMEELVHTHSRDSQLVPMLLPDMSVGNPVNQFCPHYMMILLVNARALGCSVLLIDLLIY